MALVQLQKDVLIDICSDLDSDDLEKLKFLLKDVAGLSKLKTATIALELFNAIEHNKHVGLFNGRFLGECFELMGRTDLVRKLGLNPQTVAMEMGETRYSIRPFRIMLYKISEDLSSEDLQRLIFYSERAFKLTRKEKQSLSSAFDLFVLLEKRGHLTVLNTKCLKNMMKTLENRGDLVDLVTSYQVKYTDQGNGAEGTTPINDDDNDEYDMLYESLRDVPKQRQDVPRPIQYFQRQRQDVPRQRQDVPRQSPLQNVPRVAYYEMTSNPRGICVIISNKKFTRMHPREGTEVDQAKLEATFKKLGFIIKRYENLNVKDMVGVMKDISILDHSKYQALVVCILSHGGENFIYRTENQQSGTNQRQPVRGEDDRPVEGNFVYGVDDNVVPIRYLTMYFQSSKCKTLASKPKLFFIQACQGEDMETGVLLSSDLQQDGPSVVDFIDMDVDPTSLPHEEEMDASPQPADNKKVIPNESDFLLGYATVFGYVSYRSKTKGSFYIKSLTENLNNFSDTLDLQGIMTQVNHDVAEENIRLGPGEAKKQIPMVQTTLRKQLFFSPDNIN